MKTSIFTPRILTWPAGMLMLAMLFAAGFCFTACSNTATQSDATTNDTAAVEEEEGETDAQEFTEEDIAALKAKFTQDESGYYHHNLWGNNLVPRRTLTALVNQTGYFILSSNYYANKALKHHTIKVKTGEEELVSEKMDIKAAEHVVQNVDGKVYEMNSFTNYRDKGIFQKIGQSPLSQEFSITYQAQGAHVEEKLARADQEALIDCYRLSLVLNAERQATQ